MLVMCRCTRRVRMRAQLLYNLRQCKATMYMRTMYMRAMLVTLEVSNVIGWLNERALCRGRNGIGHPKRKRHAGLEAGLVRCARREVRVGRPQLWGLSLP